MTVMFYDHSKRQEEKKGIIPSQASRLSNHRKKMSNPDSFKEKVKQIEYKSVTPIKATKYIPQKTIEFTVDLNGSQPKIKPLESDSNGSPIRIGASSIKSFRNCKSVAKTRQVVADVLNYSDES